MDYKRINNIVGWVVFVIAAYVFVSTVEPSTSLWDCGEYITTSYKLEVGHPPGAPVYMMIGRIFSAFTEPENAAYMINIVSALSSAFAILFLFWTITHLARKIVGANSEKITQGSLIAIMGSGAIGALAYTFTDTFWFSAVEGEVYAMSSFFTAITFWAILKWEDNAHQTSSDRWIVLIVFLIGLAIGVHMLNLLVIPAVGYVIYFKKYKSTLKGFLITGVVSIVVLGFIQSIFINSSISIAAGFERFFTNSLGMPFNTGTAFFFFFILALLGGLMYWFTKTEKRLFHLITISITVLVIGYASFAMIVVRSNANPPLDENDAETLPALQAYLGREQYGDWPLLKGGFWNSPQSNMIDSDKSGKPIKEGVRWFKAYVVYKTEKDLKNYLKTLKSPDPRKRLGIPKMPVKSFKTKADAEKYLKQNPGYKSDQKYIAASLKLKRTYDKQKYRKPSDFNKYQTFFPRMFDTRPGKVKGYMFWSNYEGNKRLPSKERKAGDVDYLIPTTKENIGYMFNYQLGWMYWRYFLWNFAGRQNDLQGHNYTYNDGMLYTGALTRGNWLTGVNFIDKERLGEQVNLPTTKKTDESYNRYYYIPLILGLLGLIFHIVKAPKDTFTIFLLFFFTGMAIVIYLNQRPEEPRERDYAYAASFYAFAVWIGLSVLALYHWGKTLTKNGMVKGFTGAIGAIVLFLLADYINGGGMAFGYSIAYMVVIGLVMLGVAILLGRILKNELALAVFACLIGFSAPYILASENWDDHDRSKRYFARDIAHNYLGSCGENAILFCFGDNDTFPLWFAQEVEGYRTDMKVINYALLSSDWHFNQLKRATYEAPYVETTLEEEDYRAGTRDYVQLGNSKQTISAKAFVNYMKANRDKGIASLTGSGIVPFRSLYIEVDKDAAIANGIVDESQRDQLVDRISWTLSGGVATKADIAIIDVLANYKWDRPICFTTSSIQGANVGLSLYLQQQGMAATLVPLPKHSNRYAPKINEDKLYSLLVEGNVDMNLDGNKNNRFEWGDLKRDDVFADYYTLRMVRSGRQGFMQTANAFINQANALQNNANDTLPNKAERVKGLKQKAINLLDRHFEELPIHKVKLDASSARLATLYYRAGDSVKGDQYSEQHAKLIAENIAYLLNQKPDYINEMYDELGNFVGLFQELEAGNKAKFSLKSYDKELAEQLINTIDTDIRLYQKVFVQLKTFYQKQGNYRMAIPYPFIKENMSKLEQDVIQSLQGKGRRR